MNILMDKVTEEVLAELEKTQKEFWNIPRKTGVLLNMFIKMMNSQNALEIGTSNGYSGLWLAKALKETGGKLTTIEFYENPFNFLLITLSIIVLGVLQVWYFKSRKWL